VAGRGAGVRPVRRRRRAGRQGHRPDRAADVVPAQRLVRRQPPRARPELEPGHTARGDPVRPRAHQAHLPRHAGLRHVGAARHRAGRHGAVRPDGVRRLLGPLGHRAGRHDPQRQHRAVDREVDPRPGARVRQLEPQAVDLGPVPAELLLDRRRQPGPRRARAEPAADPELSARPGAFAVAGQQRDRLRPGELALVVALARGQLRPGDDALGPEAAAEHRSRLRLQRTPWQPELGRARRRRAIQSHPYATRSSAPHWRHRWRRRHGPAKAAPAIRCRARCRP